MYVFEIVKNILMELTIDKSYNIHVYCRQDNLMRCKYLFLSHLFSHENYCHLQLAIRISTAYSIGVNILLRYIIVQILCTFAQVIIILWFNNVCIK